MRDKKLQVPVSRRGVFQRINRTLKKKEMLRLRQSRAGTAAQAELGDYFIVSTDDNRVVKTKGAGAEYRSVGGMGEACGEEPLTAAQKTAGVTRERS
jgi:hypothetical protein